MSYKNAEDILPAELIEAIRQYVSGETIYIPSKEKKSWGSQTKAAGYYRARNEEIRFQHEKGASVKALADRFSLSEKSIQRILREMQKEQEIVMSEYRYITLDELPSIKDEAAEWFHSKWGVPKEAYLECMEQYLNGETPNGWYLCLDGDRIVGGMGVIDNDFHDRKDLAPNVCAVVTEEAYRGQGIAGRLLNLVVADMKEKGVSPLYLVTDHVGFYERYGWEFFCMAQGDGEPEMTRLYIHR